MEREGRLRPRESARARETISILPVKAPGVSRPCWMLIREVLATRSFLTQIFQILQVAF